MIELVPALAARYDIADVVGAIPPRELLLVSATHDEYSSDVGQVLEQAGLTDVVHHVHASGDHGLDSFRSEAIINWLVDQATNAK